MDKSKSFETFDALQEKANKFGIKTVSLAGTQVDESALKLVDEKIARHYKMFPIGYEGKHLVLVMADPFNQEAITKAQFTAKQPIKPLLAEASEINDMINRFYTMDESLNEFLENLTEGVPIEVIRHSLESGEGLALEHSGKAKPIVKLVNNILSQAVAREASDVHIEPYEKYAIARIRIDGVLTDLMNIPKWLHSGVVSRIKIMADMDIAEHRRPQDGHIDAEIHNRAIDFRVSSLPTRHGEKVVIRILEKEGKNFTLDDLNLEPEYANKLKQTLKNPQGMVLVTGPTGSGKTTTLYAILSYLASEQVNIVTVEDPIEYQITRINQVQVNIPAGLTFATALRSILRQDPDIVMVGEIRDLETAEIAVQASLTGHLMLSTVHTNNCVSTITRLVDVGIQPFLIASSLLMVMSQRLVRRVCEHCKTEYKPDSEVLKNLQLPTDFKYIKGAGCRNCGGTGYRGRAAVMEIMYIDEALKSIIEKGCSEQDCLEAARRRGFRNLLGHGHELIRRGITTPEELRSVIQLTDDMPNLASVGFVKPSPLCPSCNRQVEDAWKICPYCLHHLTDDAKIKTEEIPTEPAPVPTFYIEEPTPIPTPVLVAAPEVEVKQKETPMNRPNILLVDDDPNVAQLATAVLERMDCEVRWAKDGQEALDFIDRRYVPHMIILDLIMPRLGGMETLKRMRSRIETAFVPILILSSQDSAETIEKAYSYGTDDFMPKPFKPKDLRDKVNELLKKTFR